MCGIAGIVGPGAEHQRAVVEAMLERVRHRGPDDAGVWTAPGVALAHRRLSILDLSPAGHQPMTSECGRYTITYNGEVYNYVELKTELEAAGDTFRSGSDTEVLLAGLKRWGTEALKRCNGMWSFALWDRETRTLTASRDRFGKKPFYYTEHGGHLYFASEIKALLRVPGLKVLPNAVAVADFAIERISGHGEETLFVGIRQLPAAHNLVWHNGWLTTSRYWELTTTEPGQCRAASTDEIRAGLISAVKLRLRADTPVGCLLSGGLDSSAIACLIDGNQKSGMPTHLFSTIHDPPYQEADGIAAVRKQIAGNVFHPDMPSADGFWRDLAEVLWHQEQPFGDASMVAHYGLMRVARAAGVPVLLSGQGADEVFAGYPGHLWIYLGSRLRSGAPAEFARFWRQASRHQRIQLRSVALAMLPRALRRVAKQQFGVANVDWLSPDVRHGSDMIHHDSVSQPHADPLDQALLQSIDVRTLPGFLHYEDRNSMAFGVETRLPFLDYRLVELMFRQPPASKLAGGLTKRLLRDAMAGIVPDSIRLSPLKTGYPAPLQAWLRARPAEFLDTARVRDCPLVVAPVWEGLARRFLGGEDALLIPVWRGYIVSRWYAMFFGREART